MQIYLTLFFEFFKIGLFSIGGGLATLPFLKELIYKYNWYSSADLTNMLAISESTPGPIGINMSTYVGFHTASILGSIISTVALVLPSFLIILALSRILNKFKENKYVNSIFENIKPVVTGLILIALFEIYKVSIFNESFKSFNFFNFIIFLVLLLLISKYKKHPIFYIFLGGILGYIFNI